MLFLQNAMIQLATSYGEARRYLFLEDKLRSDKKPINPEDTADLARALGVVTAIALSINDPEITKIVRSRLWIERPDDTAIGEVQKAIEDIIEQLSKLIEEAPRLKSL